MTLPRAYWRQDSFTGGMVSRSSPTQLRRNECERLMNFDLHHTEHAIKRTGITKMNATALAGAVQGVHAYRIANGNREIIVVAAGTIYRWNGTSFVSLATGLASTATIRVNFVEFGDLLIILNGVDAPRKYDPSVPSVALLGGSPPVATFGAFYYNHLFLGGVPNEPTSVYYSETFNPEDGYAAKNYIVKMAVSDQSDVTALLPLDQELIVGKRRSITAIRGMDPRDFSTEHNRAAYTNEQGILNQNCILDVGGVPWFMNEFGIFSLQGPFVTPEQSWAVHGYIEKLDPTRIRRAFGIQVQLKRQAVFFVPYGAGTHMDTGLVGHVGQGRNNLAAWSLWKGPELTAAAVLFSDLDGEVVYYGDAAGFVYKTASTFQDDHPASQGPVTATYVSDSRPGPQPEELSMLRSVTIEAEVGELTNATLEYHADRRRLEDSRAVALAAPVYESSADADDPLGSRQNRRVTAFSDHLGMRHQVEVVHAENKPFRLAAVETETVSVGRRRGRDR